MLGVGFELAAPADDATLADLRARFALDKYILYVGTIEPRKNLLGLMQAFERCAVAHPGVKLVIAGKLGWDYQKVLDYAQASSFSDRIVFTGYIDEAQKRALLKAATVFAYVSFYEGFGLPVLEGMASGVPTITSSISSMPEVAGDGALLVDPNDTGQIADAIATLLDSEASRDTLVRRGLAQSRAFTWDSMTARSLAFYRQVVSQR